MEQSNLGEVDIGGTYLLRNGWQELCQSAADGKRDQDLAKQAKINS